MLEFARASVAVVRCFGGSRALDAFPSFGAVVCRIAPDELWLVGGSRAKSDLTRCAESYLAGADPDGLVLEQSDGWSAWTLSGHDVSRAFPRLSAIPLPPTRPAFLQGVVASVPAKVLAISDRLYLVVPVQLDHVVPARILGACADLRPRQTDELEFAVEKGGVTARAGV